MASTGRLPLSACHSAPIGTAERPLTPGPVNVLPLPFASPASTELRRGRADISVHSDLNGEERIEVS